MSKEKYTPTTIPAKLPATLFTHYRIQGYGAGELVNYDFDASGAEYILIAETKVTVKIPPIGDLKKKVIDALETEKKNQQSAHLMKMKELQERINSLLAIEYTPQE